MPGEIDIVQAILFHDTAGVNALILRLFPFAVQRNAVIRDVDEVGRRNVMPRVPLDIKQMIPSGFPVIERDEIPADMFPQMLIKDSRRHGYLTSAAI